MSLDAYEHLIEPGHARAPLLVLLHGTGGDATDLLPLGRSLLADASLLAPAGDVSEAGAARFFRRTAEGVYDTEDLARATAKMTGFVRAHRERLQPSAVIGLGYSNGANILATALFAEPALWDAAVLLHPLIPFEPVVGGGFAAKPVLITAGRRDPICPPALTARFASWVEAAGAALTLEWHEGGHELRQSEIDASRRFLARFAATEDAT
jgi:phospholipase/carboxylesterase